MVCKLLYAMLEREQVVYHVGEGSEDHNYWGPPELQYPDLNPGPSYSIAGGVASDQYGGAAAALTIMYYSLITDNGRMYKFFHSCFGKGFSPGSNI